MKRQPAASAPKPVASLPGMTIIGSVRVGTRLAPCRRYCAARPAPASNAATFPSTTFRPFFAKRRPMEAAKPSGGKPSAPARTPTATMFLASAVPAFSVARSSNAMRCTPALSAGGSGISASGVLSCSSTKITVRSFGTSSVRNRAKSAQLKAMSTSSSSPCDSTGSVEIRSRMDDSPPRICGPKDLNSIPKRPCCAAISSTSSPAETTPSPPAPAIPTIKSLRAITFP
jgi:hypothetical protein